MWRAVLLTVCILLTTRYAASERHTPRPGYLWVCRQNPVDIAFVIDASNSIWGANFTLGLDFIHDFLMRYDIAGGKVHVGVVMFSEGVFPDVSFGFTRYSNKSQLLDAILNLPYVGGYRTDTGLGIRYMRKSIMAEARQEVPHIGIVITDGQSQDRKLTALEAALARSSGVSMFAIGVGLHVSFQELTNIAGDPDNAFSVQNYEALQAIKDKLEYRTCIEKLGPTPPPPPPCGERHPSNVVFVFDPVALSREALSAIKSFMAEVIQHEDMELGMQYGVSSGRCPDDAGVAIGNYENPDVLMERLVISQDRLVRLLDNAGAMFSNSGNEASKHVVVFFENELDVNQVMTYLNKTFSDDVTVTMIVIVEGESSPLHPVLDNVWLGSGEELTALGREFVEQICSESLLVEN